MKARKAKKRLESRIKGYQDSGLASKPGYKKPGSLSK